MSKGQAFRWYPTLWWLTGCSTISHWLKALSKSFGRVMSVWLHDLLFLCFLIGGPVEVTNRPRRVETVDSEGHQLTNVFHKCLNFQGKTSVSILLGCWSLFGIHPWISVKLYCSKILDEKSRFDNGSNMELEWRLQFAPFTYMSLRHISGWYSRLVNLIFNSGSGFIWKACSFLIPLIFQMIRHLSENGITEKWVSSQGKKSCFFLFFVKHFYTCRTMRQYYRPFLQWLMPPKWTAFRACGLCHRPASWIQWGRLISSEVMCVGVLGGLSFCSLSEPNRPDQPLNLSPVLLDDGPNEQLISPGALGNWEMTPEPASCANKIW